MKKIKEFLNYSKNTNAEHCANQLHPQVGLILNKILNW